MSGVLWYLGHILPTWHFPLLYFVTTKAKQKQVFSRISYFAQITWKTINNLIVPSNLNPKKNLFFPRENEKVMTKTVKQITNCTVQIKKNFLLFFIKRSSRRCCCLFAVFLFQASRYSLIWCESRLLTWTFSQSENEKSKSKSGKWWFYSLLWDCVRMAGN